MFSDLLLRIEAELSEMADGTRIRLVRKATWSGNWQPKQAVKALRRAIQDPEPDILLACGDLVLQAAAKPGLELDRPVMGLSFLPWKSEVLRRPGLNPVGPHGFFLRDLKRLRDLTGARQMSLLLEPVYLESVNSLAGMIARLERELGIRLDAVPLQSSSLEGLHLKGKAAYVAPLPRLQSEERRMLFRNLYSRSLPTFSCLGHPEVRLGCMAGLCPDLLQRMARRAALNLQQLRLGLEADRLSGLEVFPGTLLLNALAARKVGFQPDRELLLEAEILHPEALEGGDEPLQVLTLERAMDLAAKNSPAVEEKLAEVRRSRQRFKQARSALLPQVEGRMRYRQIDRDRSSSSLGLFPRKETKAGFSIRQAIFSDPLISRYLAAGKSSRAQEMRSAAVRLDSRYRAGERFLSYLQAKAEYRIQRDTLRLIREHRRLARIREQVGISGPEEVYRLEIKLAEQKEAVLSAQASRDNAKVALNRALGLSQDTVWTVRDRPRVGSNRLSSRWEGLFGSPDRAGELYAEAVRLALSRAPELRALEEAIEAASIELAQKKRRFFVPRLGLRVDYDHLLQREEAAAELPDSGSSPGRMSPADLLSGVASTVSSADDEEWLVALEMKLPLFQGGARVHQVREAGAEMARLRAKRRLVSQDLEQRVRSAANAMQSSRPRIELAKGSARYAKKHLRLLEERYRQGKAGLLDLLDAQNANRKQAERKALSGYAYLRDVLAFQRALAVLGTDNREK